MSHSMVDQFFARIHDYIENRRSSHHDTFSERFMSQVKREFIDGFQLIKKGKSDKKYSFNELVQVLDLCEQGQCNKAIENYDKAFKEYQTFINVLDTIITNEIDEQGPNRATTNDGKKITNNNRSQNPRVSMESPIGGQSATQSARDKPQTSLSHTPNKMLLSMKDAEVLSSSGRSGQKIARNTDERDSNNDRGTQLHHSDFRKDRNQYSMLYDNNEISTRQRATPSSTMEKGWSFPGYQIDHESNKSIIQEIGDTLSLKASSVSLSGSNVHERRNKSDDTKGLKWPKTEYLPNEPPIYRRSMIASILLRDNNPNIADLSDPNRPTKLAERFSELYNNEHTDVFEEIVKCHRDGIIGEDQEKEIVEDLLYVVKHAYEHCKNRNDVIENMLENEKQIKPPKPTDEIIQIKDQLLERKKTLFKAQANDVLQEFMEKKIPNLSPRHASEKAKSKFVHYAKATVEIVWWMFARNPPIYLMYAECGPFISDRYQYYTKSGQFVAFCVWPLVLLYENGPILLKGIAQGTNVQPNSK